MQPNHSSGRPDAGLPLCSVSLANVVMVCALIAPAITSCGLNRAGANSPAVFRAPIFAQADPADKPGTWGDIEQAVVNPGDYSLVQIPTLGLEHFMVPGSGAQNVPTNLQGIWWMDGNILAPGNVVSFAHALWDNANRRVLVQEYGENNYTYDASDEGRSSYADTVRDNLIFEASFDADFTVGRLIQVQRGQKSPITEVDYTMNLVADGDWLRRSAWRQQDLPDYHLRRIVDGEGHRLESAYSDFLKVAPEYSLLPQQRK